jgi:putative peptidoglycan lipid II flippase
MARDISLSAFKLLLPAQAAALLVPMFLTMRVRRADDAWHAAAAVLVALLAVATPIVIAVVLLSPVIVDLLAPGFSAATADQTVILLRILALSMWLMLATSLAAALLTALERFGRSTVTNLVGQASLVVLLPLLVASDDIVGAAWAFVGSAAIQALLTWGLLMVEGMPPLANPFRHRAEVGQFGRGLVPFLGYAAAVQASGVVFRISASLLKTGLFAAQSLARQLFNGLFALIFVPLQTIVLPSLAQHAAEDRDAEFAAELRAALRYSIFMVVPVAVVLAVLAGPAVSFVFERGEFSGADAHNTALAMRVYAFAIVFTGLYTVMEQAAYARGQNRLIVGTNIRIEALQAPLYIGLTLLLGVVGIPLAGLIGSAFGAGYYLYRFTRGDFSGALQRQGGFFWRVCLCAALTALAVWGTWKGVDALVEPGVGLDQAVSIVPAALVGLVVYCALSLAVGLRELPNLTALFEGRFRRRRG